MKNTVILLSLLSLLQCTSTQSEQSRENKTGEFVIYENGLIYDKTTMAQLGETVDSLNLRFKKCEPKNYRSLEQGYGTYISVAENVGRARQAILRNIELEEFLRNFPSAVVKKDLWIVKEHITWDGIRSIEYRSEGIDHIYLDVPDTLDYDKGQGWVYQDLGASIRGIFLHKLTTTTIPVEYARFIQYVDCMIDTTATIFPEHEKPDSLTYILEPGSKVKHFIDLAMDFEGKPEEPQLDGNDDSRDAKIYKQYEALMKEWNDRRIAALDTKMQEPANLRLLNDAVDEAIVNQNGFYLDYYAGRYLPSKKSLELKRSFRVHGFCSADSGPRDHAQAICKLAAENHQWDIFLRAHLDILNDNFDRASDGNWAWGARKTYIKELEELEINAVDLLVGATLNSKDISSNHYRARTSRIGRAFSESKFKGEIEDRLLSMTQDPRLDLYNRMEMAYTFIFYNRNLEDKERYVANLSKIKTAIRTLPDDQYLRYSPLLED